MFAVVMSLCLVWLSNSESGPKWSNIHLKFDIFKQLLSRGSRLRLQPVLCFKQQTVIINTGHVSEERCLILMINVDALITP